MSYCTPGQVLVSRSYFEVVSRMSQEFARLFHYEGARTDKHVREHEIYAVVAGGAALRRAPDGPESHHFGEHESAAVIEHMKRAGIAMKGGLRRHTKRAVALAALVVLGAAIALVVHRSPPSDASAEAQNPAPSQPELAAAEQPAAQPPTATQTVPAAPPAPKASAAHPAKQAIVTRPAVLSFAITPWGEIYIDGKKHGASPPVREIRVPPGKHKIEIRNSGFPSHIVAIDAKSGARMEIKYVFH
jgi:PEGA domain